MLILQTLSGGGGVQKFYTPFSPFSKANIRMLSSIHR